VLLLATIGLAAVLPARGGAADVVSVATKIAIALLFLCLVPSTVQSSIAFTSIARGNVPAAIVSATLSNMLGVFLTPPLVVAPKSSTAARSCWWCMPRSPTA
jgi:predicted Na+-dependent transporter